MAIKIIKEGKVTKFTKTCPDCGCEFEYEQEDVNVDYTVFLTSYPGKYNTYVICPCCGKHLDHGYKTFPNTLNVSYTDATAIGFLDCETCPYKPDPKKPTAGDSPCDWCIKRNLTYK